MLKYPALSSLILFSALELWGQAPRVNPERAPESPEQIIAANSARFDYRPDIMIMTQIVRALQPAAKVTAEGKALVDKLVEEAAAFQEQGSNGDARRLLSHAITLQLGGTWDTRTEYSASLVLRTDMTVADSSRLFVAQLAQRYPARYPDSSGLRLRVSLVEGGIPARADVVAAAGSTIAELALYDLPNRDLIDDPCRFDADLSKVPEGSYLVRAEVLDEYSSIGHLVTPVYLVHNLDARRLDIEGRLAKIQGHESTAASIRYPWDVARGINAARREVNHFDFAAEVRKAETLLKTLESGQDPLYRTTGDNRRAYFFAQAGEIMPYRIYVPTTWTPTQRLPMILALHGSQLDENNFITRAEGLLCKLAEKHGYVIAAPLGYRINGGYGRLRAPGARPAGSPARPDRLALRTAQLSETDAMNVMELVATEYNVDRSHIYVTGNSMGGGGTWLLGAKFAEKFAGMAPCASGINDPEYPYHRLKGMPIMAVVGELDRAFLQPVRDVVRRLEQEGVHAELVEVKDGTHSTAVEETMPKIVEFFNTHRRTAVP